MQRELYCHVGAIELFLGLLAAELHCMRRQASKRRQRDVTTLRMGEYGRRPPYGTARPIAYGMHGRCGGRRRDDRVLGRQRPDRDPGGGGGEGSRESGSTPALATPDSVVSPDGHVRLRQPAAVLACFRPAAMAGRPADGVLVRAAETPETLYLSSDY